MCRRNTSLEIEASKGELYNCTIRSIFLYRSLEKLTYTLSVLKMKKERKWWFCSWGILNESQQLTVSSYLRTTGRSFSIINSSILRKRSIPINIRIDVIWSCIGKKKVVHLAQDAHDLTRVIASWLILPPSSTTIFLYVVSKRGLNSLKIKISPRWRSQASIGYNGAMRRERGVIY